MSAARWNLLDGLCTVDATASLDQVVLEGLSQQRHLGTLTVLHATVQDGLHAADPGLAHRLVRATVHGRAGDLGGPVSPRAAAGPDLACFVTGVDTAVRDAVFRVELVAAWGHAAALARDAALQLARTLAGRGCTLVELRAQAGGTVDLWAALPRAALASLVSPTPPPPLARARSVLGWRVTWPEVPRLWDALAADAEAPGTLLLHALNPDFAALRLVLPADAPAVPADGVARLRARHLGPPPGLHPDLLLALSLRSHAPHFHAVG